MYIFILWFVLAFFPGLPWRVEHTHYFMTLMFTWLKIAQVCTTPFFLLGNYFTSEIMLYVCSNLHHLTF